MTPQQLYRIKYGISPDVEARLWAKIIKRGDDECWGWTGAKDPFGRAKWRPHPSGSRFPSAQVASRIMHGLATGEEPPMVCHTCDNPECTNPNHLYSGNAQTNMRDARERQRTVKGRRRLPLRDRARISERYAKGDPVADICADYGLTLSKLRAVIATARRDGVAPRRRRATLVSASDVADIIRMRQDGRTLKYIANQYGVHESYISRIAAGHAVPQSGVSADAKRTPKYVIRKSAASLGIYGDVERLNSVIKRYAKENGYKYGVLVARIVSAGLATLEKKTTGNAISLDIAGVE